MMSLHISIVRIMLFTKTHHLFILLYLWLFFLISLTNACNIWKASDCPQPPTADDEEIVLYLLDFSFGFFIYWIYFSLNMIYIHVNNFFNFVIKEKNMWNVLINNFIVVI
jgi:hypothetical protein